MSFIPRFPIWKEVRFVPPHTQPANKGVRVFSAMNVIGLVPPSRSPPHAPPWITLYGWFVSIVFTRVYISKYNIIYLIYNLCKNVHNFIAQNVIFVHIITQKVLIL